MNAHVTNILHWPSRIAVAACVALVRLYQLTLSPLLGPACRFQPTCSQYMIDALHKYGAIRGVCKGLARLCRCHPFRPGGYDPP